MNLKESAYKAWRVVKDESHNRPDINLSDIIIPDLSSDKLRSAAAALAVGVMSIAALEVVARASSADVIVASRITAPQSELIARGESSVDRIILPPAPTPDPISELKKLRPPDGSRNDALEEEISMRILETIELTPEGYEEFKKNINTEFKGSLDRPGIIPMVNGAPLKVVPQFFVSHHTAHPFSESTKSLIDFFQRLGEDDIKGNEKSVQWVIDRNAVTYQIASDPLNMAYHAKDFNMISTGVEVETFPGDKHGDLTKNQYEALAYMNMHAVIDYYKIPPNIATKFMVGHRELNDRYGRGTSGKPDFPLRVQDVLRRKVDEAIQRFYTIPPVPIPQP